MQNINKVFLVSFIVLTVSSCLGDNDGWISRNNNNNYNGNENENGNGNNNISDKHLGGVATTSASECQTGKLDSNGRCTCANELDNTTAVSCADGLACCSPNHSSDCTGQDDICILTFNIIPGPDHTGFTGYLDIIAPKSSYACYKVGTSATATSVMMTTCNANALCPAGTTKYYVEGGKPHIFGSNRFLGLCVCRDGFAPACGGMVYTP